MRGLLPALLLTFLAGGQSVAQTAYVTNAGDATISVIDTARRQVVSTLKLTGNLSGVAVSPDGARLFAAAGQNRHKNTLLVLDTRSGAVVKTVQVGDTPGALASSPDGATVYSAEDNFLTVISGQDGNIAARLPLVTLAAAVDVSPDGRIVFVSAPAETAVKLIDARNRAVLATVELPGIPGGLACSPDGRQLYVTDTESGTLVVIDVARRAIAATIPVGSGPFGVAGSPDGTRAYVTATGRSPRAHEVGGQGSVVVVDTARRRLLARVPVGDVPHGVAVTPDGRAVLAVNLGSDTVSVIDTQSNTVSAVIPVGRAPGVFGRFIGPRPPSP